MKKIFAPILALALFSVNLASAQVVSVTSVDSNANYQGFPIASQNYFCPRITHSLSKGNSDAGTNGDVSQLQRFLKTELNLNDNQLIVTGYFGRLTESFVRQYQSSNGISPYGIVGSITRSKIIGRCGNGGGGGTGNANFRASITSGQAPLTVNFTSSVGGTINFGDGQTVAMTNQQYCTQQYPNNNCGGSYTASHTYTSNGTYTAQLTSTNCPVNGNGDANFGCLGVVRLIGSVTITVGGQTTTGEAFSATPTSGNSPLNVLFGTIYSDAMINFGDGTATVNPSFNNSGCYYGAQGCTINYTVNHTYNSPGTYTATLYRTNPSCVTCDQLTLRQTITVSDTGTGNVSFTAQPTSGSAPLFVTFNANNTNVNSRYSIDFGDSQSNQIASSCYYGQQGCGVNLSTTHTYTSAGTYTATLTENNCPIGAYCLVGPRVVGTVTVVVGGQTTTGDAFSATPTSGNSPLNVLFGTIYSDSVINFGDGTATVNPSFNNSGCYYGAQGCTINYTVNHTYNSPGTYYATLTRTTPICFGCAPVVYNQTITVNGSVTGNEAVYANPNPTRMNQSVVFTTGSQGDGTYYINYGDNTSGTMTVSSCTNSIPGSCTYSSNHSYSYPGTYTVNVTKAPICSANLACPLYIQNVGSVIVTVNSY